LSEHLEPWKTSIGIHMFDHAEKINPLFERIFKTMRATDVERPSGEKSGFYASQDDLLNRVKLSEWNDFLQFVVASLRDTARFANQRVWPADQVDLQIGIQGIWFQISNSGVSHDIHTHGNCSWSGVYVVSVDDDDTRCKHPVYGRLNGATRFYSPLFERLGGAYMDFGNAYLQSSVVDFDPVPGRLIVFPSWLPHQAMAYEGSSDRVIVSFNASIHRKSDGDAVSRYSNT
jgi:uncharacterized protein (TIGR02466 family)